MLRMMVNLFFLLLVTGRPPDDHPMDTRGVPTPGCKPQSHHHVAFGQWANRPNVTHKLSMLTPSMHHHSFRTISQDEFPTAGDLLAGSTECPATPASAPDEPIMGRSLCPWYWKVNYNANRIPAMLPEAVCRCRKAVSGVNRIVAYECQPMTMHVRVLQLDDQCKEYQERSIEVAVACVSVLQSSMRLNKIAGVEHTGVPTLMREI